MVPGKLILEEWHLISRGSCPPNPLTLTGGRTMREQRSRSAPRHLLWRKNSICPIGVRNTARSTDEKRRNSYKLHPLNTPKPAQYSRKRTRRTMSKARNWMWTKRLALVKAHMEAMPKVVVTTSISTPESAAEGECDSRKHRSPCYCCRENSS